MFRSSVFLQSSQIHQYAIKSGLKRIKNVKNIIAVGSGKGGVGKSTVCLNLATSLQQLGAKVGILDADIYGPSLPMLIGVDEKDMPKPTNPLTPIKKYDLATMSLGYLVGQKDAAIWRGPMASGALMQLLEQTGWPELDYLFIDLPPGTGDIQLTLAQKIPVIGALVVSTPQKLAAKIAGKSIAMFKKVNIPVIGAIENMGPYLCGNCGEKQNIFGNSGNNSANTLAKDYNVELLGTIPLDYTLRESSDNGIPAVLSEDNLAIKNTYQEIAASFIAELNKLHSDDKIKLKEIRS